MPLATSDLSGLDAQTESQPDEAIRDAKARVAAAQGKPHAFLRAQLFAILADAHTVLSQTEQAAADIVSARTALQGLPLSADVRQLQLRLQLLDAQLLIAGSNSTAAVNATGQLLVNLMPASLARACTLSIRAIAHDYLHQPDLAVSDALIAYRIAVDGQWPNAKLEAAGTLARIFGRAGLYPQAEQMINVVISIARSDDRVALLSTAEYERGMLLVMARQFSDARVALEKSKWYATQINDRFAVAAANANLCWAFIREGDFDNAEKACQGGDADLTSGSREDLRIQLIGNRARLDLERHRPAAAIQKLNRILTPKLHALLPASEPSFYWDRGRALRELNRISEANADFVRTHELEEAADNAQRNRQVAVLSALIASDELEAENRHLQERIVLQQREDERQRTQQFAVIAAALIIGTLLACLLWISHRHSRVLRRQESILRSAGHNAPDAFLLLDEQRRVRFANRNLCGHGSIPAVGEPVSSSIPAILLPTLTTAIDGAFERRTVMSFAVSIPGTDGSPRQFEMCAVPAIESDRVVGGTLRAIDVTEHQELERRVVDSASHERQQLSNDLHEGVGQQLAGVLLLLGSASNAIRRGLPEAGSLIDEITQYVRQAIDTTRELARGLAPVKIDMGSLTVALQRLVVDAGERLRIVVDCSCQLDDILLTDLAADHLYGICREAITHAALHNYSSRMRIDIRTAGDALLVSINDEGNGIPAKGPYVKGLGMSMMAYRTRLLGGQCQLTTLPGGGTCVVAEIPLHCVIAAHAV